MKIDFEGYPHHEQSMLIFPSASPSLGTSYPQRVELGVHNAERAVHEQVLTSASSLPTTHPGPHRHADEAV